MSAIERIFLYGGSIFAFIFVCLVAIFFEDGLLSSLMIALSGSAFLAILFWKEKQNYDKGIRASAIDFVSLFIVVFVLNLLGYMLVNHFGYMSMPHSQLRLSLWLSFCFALISCILFYGLEKVEDGGENS